MPVGGWLGAFASRCVGMGEAPLGDLGLAGQVPRGTVHRPGQSGAQGPVRMGAEPVRVGTCVGGMCVPVCVCVLGGAFG